MFTFNAHAISTKFARFLQLQLFIWLIALPILLCWGLPFSLLAPIGNLLFSPFLSIFLLFSSLVFFSELLHIPNSIVVWCLEKTTSLWLMLINAIGKGWLIGLAQPSAFIIMLIPCAALILLHSKRIKTTYLNLISFSLLFFTMCSYIWLVYTPATCISTISCNKGNIALVYTNKKTTIIDPGLIGQRPSAVSFMEYTLLPTLTKKIGTTCIDCFIALQPSGTLFEALTVLIKKDTIKKIYLPWWDGRIKKNAWRNFMRMRKAAKQHNVIFRCIFNKPILLNQITITPLEKKLSYHEATYPACKVTSSIDDKNLELYSWKYQSKRL